MLEALQYISDYNSSRICSKADLELIQEAVISLNSGLQSLTWSGVPLMEAVKNSIRHEKTTCKIPHPQATRTDFVPGAAWGGMVTVGIEPCITL